MGCCDTCPMVPTCEEAAIGRCDMGLHDWMARGVEGDRWRECFLCGELEDEDEDGDEDGDDGRG